MFEVGWTEMLVIAVVMIVVVGPKDLPAMLRTFGRMTAKMRGMAGDFRRQFDEALKEAELDDVKKSVDQLRGLNPMTEVKKQLNPFEKAAADVRAGIDQAMKPKPAPAPAVESADAPATPAEPLKNGATDMPGVAGPQMPAAPVFPAMTEAPVAGTGATAASDVLGKKTTAAVKTPAKARSAKAASATPAKATPASAAAKSSTQKTVQIAAPRPAKAKDNVSKASAKAVPAKAPSQPAAKPAKAKAAAKAAPSASPTAAKKTARAK